MRVWVWGLGGMWWRVGDVMGRGVLPRKIWTSNSYRTISPSLICVLWQMLGQVLWISSLCHHLILQHSSVPAAIRKKIVNWLQWVDAGRYIDCSGCLDWPAAQEWLLSFLACSSRLVVCLLVLQQAQDTMSFTLRGLDRTAKVVGSASLSHYKILIVRSIFTIHSLTTVSLLSPSLDPNMICAARWSRLHTRTAFQTWGLQNAKKVRHLHCVLELYTNSILHHRGREVTPT